MSEDAPHILVVDDDTRLRRLLSRYLIEQGFRVTTAADAEEARGKLTSLTFDLLVVDIMMPGENGLDLTQSLRKASGVPILLLTAMGESEHRIDGLERGADDYLVKPFEPRELVLRLQAILRRAREPGSAQLTAHGFVTFGGYYFDLKREELRCGEEYVYLTEAEAWLLATLARHVGEPVSRDQIAAENPYIGNERSIDVQVTRLRRKIEKDPKHPRFLQTVRGTGYMLVGD